jgi:thiol:disulfide interchange protein DsbD
MMRWLSVLWVLLVVTGCHAEADDVSANKIQWVSDLNEGLRLAKENGKPAMLYFTADWCGPCVELKKHVFSDRKVAEASRRLVNIYVDVDRNHTALAEYRVRGIPAIFFLSPGGEIVGRYLGDRTPSSFVKQMNAVASQHSR